MTFPSSEGVHLILVDSFKSLRMIPDPALLLEKQTDSLFKKAFYQLHLAWKMVPTLPQLTWYCGSMLLQYTVRVSSLKDNLEITVGAECGGLAAVGHQVGPLCHSLSTGTPLCTGQIPSSVQTL